MNLALIEMFLFGNAVQNAECELIRFVARNLRHYIVDGNGKVRVDN